MPRFDVTTLGEVMLRLSVPEGERLAALSGFGVHLGGAEANVCAALAALGRRCGWVSALPEDDLGEYALRELRAVGVDTGAVVFKTARLGLYFVEFARAPRPIRVTYDREGSAFTKLAGADLDWNYLLDTRVLHLTSITPALGRGLYALTLEAMKRAREQGVTVSFDVNYRSKLWSPEEAASGLGPLLRSTDLLICAEGDARSVFGLSGSAEEVLVGLHNLSSARHVVLTRSERGAALLIEDNLIEVEARKVHVIDRLGAGDAFAAGVLDGFLEGDVLEGVRRGTLLGALALAQRGDLLVTSRAELETLGGSASISR